MGHGHAHDGHDHGHGTGRRALTIVLGLTVAFMVVEAVGGVITGSLALLADAGHMLSDAMALALALGALMLARRPATSRMSFGWRRAEILAALVNGVTLVAVGLWVIVEGLRRLPDPPDVDGGGALVVASVGLAVNAIGATILWRADGGLNVRAALLHVLADLLGSVGVIVAAILIITTGWQEADPLVSLLIGLLILAGSWRVLREAVGVLLEAAPEGLDVDAIGRAMADSPGVTEVHDLHVWTITSGFPALSAHVTVEREEDCHGRRRELAALLGERFGIHHTTLQVDHETTRLHTVGGPPAAHPPHS